MGNLFSLEGRVAVITGAIASPIGTAAAITLAEYGADILAIDILPEDNFEVLSKIKVLGRKAVYIQCDVTDPAAVASGVERARTIFGRVNILFNNAAKAALAHVEELSEKEWDTTVNVSMRGTFLCCREFGKFMIEQRSGSIINMASIAGIIGLPRGTAHHAAAKGGIMSFTRTLAVEWAKYGIRVNAVAPGQIDTPPLQKIMADPDNAAQILKAIPIGRVGRREEVAAAVLFLASDASGFITGHTLVIDGGATIS